VADAMVPLVETLLPLMLGCALLVWLGRLVESL
jgi:hypothetical protein